MLQTLYDAVHAVALTATGATSLIHEAKVDIVTVPNLSEHLANAATTAQLSARFAYAAAMKSINNLLLLGDGETWTRQTIDFAGLPEMIRTFLQMAAGAADIPVTRLLGQSPAGLSATGDSDTRNYYDMISARQELDLRPQLERLDAVLLRSAGVDPSSVSFEFRPLWQLNASEQAQVALSKAQTTQIYAGLTLWPAATTAGLVQSQLLEDGTYPNAGPIFAAVGAMGGEAPRPTNDFDPGQPRDPDGRWAGGAGSRASQVSASSTPSGTAAVPVPPGSPHPDLLGSLIGRLNPIGAVQASERGAEAAPPPAQSSESQNESDQNNAEGMALIRAAMAPMLLLLSAHRLLKSIYRSAANLLPGKRSEPSESTSSPGDPSPQDPDNAAGRGEITPSAKHAPTTLPAAAGQTPSDVVRGFAGPKSMRTWQNQMIKRGWTAKQIEDAIRSGTSYPAENRISPGNGATRYVHPDTGRSVIIDDTTGKVIQLGGDRFKND